MNREEIVEIIEQEKLVFVTRLKDSTQALSVIGRLVSAGAMVIEITSNTPNYAQEILKARKGCPNVLIGAGTVTNEKIALEAINARAQFLVTPNTNKSLVDIAHKYDIPILMGALTPTEVCEAAEAGADFVKLFPADIMGIPYFKSIKAPLNNVKFLAVGGIALNQVENWIEAGVHGIGIASVLSEPIEGPDDLDKIEKNAVEFIHRLRD